MLKRVLSVAFSVILLISSSLGLIQAEDMPTEVTMPGIMAPATLPDRETVYFSFNKAVRKLETGESLTNGYLIILTQDRYLDYIYINGVNARTIEKTNPGAIQIHYDVNSNIFTVYIMKNTLGWLDRTKSNEIILSKDFPLLSTETLGTTYKFTNQPLADATTSTTEWIRSIYIEKLPKNVMMPDGMLDVVHSQTIYFKFVKKVKSGLPDVGNLITAVQDKYLDFIYINGAKARSIENASPGTIVMHYDVCSNVFTFYLKKGAFHELNPTTENKVILTKDFPLLGTEILGTSYEFVYSPTTTVWTKSEYTGVIDPNDKVMVSISSANPSSPGINVHDWSKEVYIKFSENIANYTPDAGDLKTLVEDHFIEYMAINGINAKETVLNSSTANKAIQIHYDTKSFAFYLFLSNGALGEFDPTKENIIILGKNLPLLDGKKLGVNLQFTYNHVSKIWSESIYTGDETILNPNVINQDRVSINISSANPNSPGINVHDWSKEVHIRFSENIANYTPDSGDLKLLVEDNYIEYMAINGVNAKEIVLNSTTVNKAIQIHYDTKGFAFYMFVCNGAIGEFDPTKENTIIFGKNLLLLDGKKLGINLQFTFNTTTKLWSKSIYTGDEAIINPNETNKDRVSVNISSANPDYPGINVHDWSKEVLIRFSENISTDTPDNGDLKTFVEDKYLDYIAVNGINGRNIIYTSTTPDKAVTMHYNTKSFGLMMYIANKSPTELDPKKENIIIISKNFPLLNGKTLGTNQKFTFDPNTKLWTKSDYTGDESIINPDPVFKDVVGVNITSPDAASPGINVHSWSKEVFIKIFEKVSDEAPDNGDLKLFVEDKYIDYMSINGMNAGTLVWKTSAANKAVTMHYNTKNYGFYMYIDNEAITQLDPTKENVIILGKNFPLLNGKKLGTNLKFTFNPKTKVWIKSIYTGNESIINPDTVNERSDLLVNISSANPAFPGINVHEWSKEVYIKFYKKVADYKPDNGDLKLLIENDYIDYIIINNMKARDIVDSAATALKCIQMHYNTMDFGFLLYLVNGAPSEFDPTKENVIILDKNFPLLDGKKLGVNLKFTYTPETKAWEKSIIDSYETVVAKPYVNPTPSSPRHTEEAAVETPKILPREFNLFEMKNIAMMTVGVVLVGLLSMLVFLFIKRKSFKKSNLNL